MLRGVEGPPGCAQMEGSIALGFPPPSPLPRTAKARVRDATGCEADMLVYETNLSLRQDGFRFCHLLERPNRGRPANE